MLAIELDRVHEEGGAAQLKAHFSLFLRLEGELKNLQNLLE